MNHRFRSLNFRRLKKRFVLKLVRNIRTWEHTVPIDVRRRQAKWSMGVILIGFLGYSGYSISQERRAYSGNPPLKPPSLSPFLKFQPKPLVPPTKDTLTPLTNGK